PRIAAKLLVHDDLVVLANDVSLEIALLDQTTLGFAGLWIDDGHRFLRRSGFAAAANARSFYRDHRAIGRAAFSHHIHDAPNGLGLCRRQDLTEHLVRPLQLELRFHEL